MNSIAINWIGDDQLSIVIVGKFGWNLNKDTILFYENLFHSVVYKISVFKVPIATDYCNNVMAPLAFCEMINQPVVSPHNGD